jgi:hypothetical protein
MGLAGEKIHIEKNKQDCLSPGSWVCWWAGPSKIDLYRNQKTIENKDAIWHPLIIAHWHGLPSRQIPFTISNWKVQSIKCPQSRKETMYQVAPIRHRTLVMFQYCLILHLKLSEDELISILWSFQSFLNSAKVYTDTAELNYLGLSCSSV